MTDLCACEGKDCPLAENCYRHTMPRGHLQSYFLHEPYKDDRCEFFLDAEKWVGHVEKEGKS